MGDAESPGRYIEVSLSIPRETADAVCNFIIENICSGLVLEEEEQSDITGVKFYLPEDDTNDYSGLLQTYLTSLVKMDSGLIEVPAISEKKIRSAEWEEEYRQSVKPIVVADDVVIRPPWEDAPQTVRYDIIIEPRMAFGTGSHESTKGCLTAIRQELSPGGRFLDMGCGSGILSILADKMGASYIKAVDNDILAVQNCGENFLINDVKAAHDIVHGSIETCDSDQPYDFVCVNIIRETIVSMLERLNALVVDGGLLVLAGLLDQDETELSEQLTLRGLNTFRVIKDNEWRTFVVRKE